MLDVKLDGDRVITDFRGQMPEGVDLQMEEVSDEDLEKILADASAKASESKAKEYLKQGLDKVPASDNPV